MPVLSSLLRPKLLALALWATALMIWLTLIGPPIPIPIRFNKFHHHSSGALPNLHPKPTRISLKEHPIKALVNQAQIDFEKLLARQSQTLSAATSAYQHRYHKPHLQASKLGTSSRSRRSSTISILLTNL